MPDLPPYTPRNVARFWLLAPVLLMAVVAFLIALDEFYGREAPDSPLSVAVAAFLLAAAVAGLALRLASVIDHVKEPADRARLVKAGERLALGALLFLAAAVLRHGLALLVERHVPRADSPLQLGYRLSRAFLVLCGFIAFVGGMGIGLWGVYAFARALIGRLFPVEQIPQLKMEPLPPQITDQAPPEDDRE